MIPVSAALYLTHPKIQSVITHSLTLYQGEARKTTPWISSKNRIRLCSLTEVVSKDNCQL